MISTITGRPVTVNGKKGEWSSIVLPYESLETVRSLFDAHQITYYVGDEVLSMDGGPERAFIDFPRKVDPEAVQRLLDGVP